MDRWRLYEALQGNHLTAELIESVEKMSGKELREGVIEYLLMTLRTRR